MLFPVGEILHYTSCVYYWELTFLLMKIWRQKGTQLFLVLRERAERDSGWLGEWTHCPLHQKLKLRSKQLWEGRKKDIAGSETALQMGSCSTTAHRIVFRFWQQGVGRKVLLSRGWEWEGEIWHLSCCTLVDQGERESHQKKLQNVFQVFG